MKWHDDLVMESIPLRQQQLQLAMYAQHLFTGNSLLHKSIRLDTIKGYVRAASSFTMLFGKNKTDPRFDRPGDSSFCDVLTKTFNAMKKFEQMPRKREPFTPEMLDFAIDMASAEGNNNSVLAALADWCVLGMNAGLRESEWAQPKNSQKSPSNYERDIFGNARAFTINDIEIETTSKRRYKGKRCLLVNPADIVKVWIRFRTQKNGKNGQRRLFQRTVAGSRRCFIFALFRVLQRFDRLVGADNDALLLSVHALPNGKVQLMTPDKVESNMQLIASRVCGSHPEKDKDALALWTCHSLRVGACVTLHALGYTETQLMWLLRWESNAFMEYLRNLPGLADKQSRALDEAAGMPEFF